MTTTTFTAKDVQELRQRTGAGMMECKKALEEANGNKELAIENLRKKGIAKDIGGVLAIRMGSKFQPMKDSRAGVITQIFSQIRSELLAALPDLIMANTKSKIMDAAGRAIKKSRGSKPKGQVGKPAAPPVVRNLDRLSRWQQRELAEAIKQEQHALSKVSARVEVFANKQVRARGAGGRFVATPVTKVVLRNKK